MLVTCSSISPGETGLSCTLPPQNVVWTYRPLPFCVDVLSPPVLLPSAVPSLFCQTNKKNSATPSTKHHLPPPPPTQLGAQGLGRFTLPPPQESHVLIRDTKASAISWQGASKSMGDNISFAQNHEDSCFLDWKADLSEKQNIYTTYTHSHQTQCQPLFLPSFLLRLDEHFKADPSEQCQSLASIPTSRVLVPAQTHMTPLNRSGTGVAEKLSSDLQRGSFSARSVPRHPLYCHSTNSWLKGGGSI